MIPDRPTVVEAKWPKLTEPETRPSHAEAVPPMPPGPPPIPAAAEAAAHEVDFRFKLESVKLKMMHPKTIMTRVTKLQKYQEVIKLAAGSSPKG